MKKYTFWLFSYWTTLSPPGRSSEYFSYYADAKGFFQSLIAKGTEPDRFEITDEYRDDNHFSLPDKP